MQTAMEILDDIVRREGSRFTDHPADRGGPTKWGVTLKVFQEVKPGATVDDLKALDEADARVILRQHFLISPRIIEIRDILLRGLVFDCAVNHGRARAVRWLQSAVKAPTDGVLGSMTLRFVDQHSDRMHQVYCDVLATRVQFFGQIITDDPRRHAAQQAGFRLQAENAAGWLNRAAEFIRLSAQV